MPHVRKHAHGSGPGTQPAPSVIGVTPDTHTLDVALDTSIRVFFSQAMDPTTITGTNLELKDGQGNFVPRTITWNPIDSSALIDPTNNMDPTEVHTVTVKTGCKNLGGIALSVQFVSDFTTLTPVTPPTGLVPMGYADVAGVDGGEGGTVYDVTTVNQFKTALQANGKREIHLHGAGNFDFNQDSFNIDNGNYSLHGEDWTGQWINHKLVHKCSNVLWTEIASRPMEAPTTAGSTDRRCFTMNPGNNIGETLHGLLIDHCSFSWAPDVIMSLLNMTTDVTVQYSMLGPCLWQNNCADGGPGKKGYGPNITVPANSLPDDLWGKRITFYRNLIIFNRQRNIKPERAQWIEFINNGVYGWGNQAGHGNPRGGNMIGNMYKKGPQTNASNQVWEPDGTYPQYDNSIYFPLAGGDANIGIGFTPTVNIQANAKLNNRYLVAPQTTLSIANADISVASTALFAEVVNAAGRTYQDSLDSAMKAHALAGTKFAGDDFYNGAGFPAPHPFTPV